MLALLREPSLNWPRQLVEGGLMQSDSSEQRAHSLDIKIAKLFVARATGWGIAGAVMVAVAVIAMATSAVTFLH